MDDINKQAIYSCVEHIRYITKKGIENMCYNQFPYSNLDYNDLIKNSPLLRECDIISDILAKE